MAATAGCAPQFVLARASHPVLHVDSPDAQADAPLAITVDGLSPGETAILRAHTIDQDGQGWSSSATFQAQRDGSMDLRSDAPLAGSSYSGTHAMGMFWALKSDDQSRVDGSYVPPGGSFAVTLSLEVGGKSVGAKAITRRVVAPGVTRRNLAVSEAGFFGAYYSSGDTTRRTPAVVIFGGSEGGLSTALVAAMLASRGYPTLALAYFREPGLPQALSNIPLEYFTGALAWLRDQPGVDPDRVLVYGISRGSEAALLLGTRYPDLVHGVIALVPSNVTTCSAGCAGPSWTAGGVPVPYTHHFDLTDPAPSESDAIIPVERIRGPIFLDCGEGDRVWASCPFAEAIMARLTANSVPYRRSLLREADVGHGIGSPLPYIAGHLIRFGGQPQPEAVAREDVWPKLLDFVANVGS